MARDLMAWILALLACTIAVVAAQERVTDGLVAHYTFTEGQTDLNAPAVLDQTGNNLLGPLNLQMDQVSWKEDSIGVEFPGTGQRVGAISEKNISALVPELVDTFAIEIWFTLSRVITDARTIMWGFKDYPTLFNEAGAAEPYRVCQNKAADGPPAYDEYAGIQFGVQSSGADLDVTFRAGDDRCTGLLSSVPEAPVASQLVITGSTTNVVDGRPYQTFYFLNGRFLQFENLVSHDPTLWPIKHLEFAPPLSTGTGIQTESFKGTVYQYSVYNRNLSFSEVEQNWNASLPNSRPFALSYTETVEEDTPVLLSLNASDFDGDALTVTVTDYSPADGSTLVARYANGTDAAVVTPYTVPAEVTGLFYTPPQDYVGVAARITYRANDGTADSRDGVITVTTSAVNDRPVATNSTANAYALQGTVLRLTGTDVDAGDSLSAARIASRPARGSLYQYDDAAPNNRGDLIAADGVAVTDAEQRVVFVSGDMPDGASGLEVVDSDSFTFYVSDVAGDESLEPATFSVSVLNNLVAINTAVATDEDVVVNVTFGLLSFVADDAVTVVIDSLPSGNGSALQTNLTSDPLTDAMLPYSVPANGAALVYTPGRDLFGAPLDSWTFHVRRDADGWRSNPATVTTTVAAVNDKPEAGLLLSDANTRLDGVVQLQAGAQTEVDFAVVLEDPDPDETTYHVSVTTDAFGSYFSLNVDAVGENSTLEYLAGDGVEDGYVIFRSLRADANKLMSGVKLNATRPGEGEITFVIRDEADGGETVSFALAFLVAEDQSASEVSATPFYTNITTMAIVSMAFLACCACCLCPFKYCAYKRRKAAELAFEDGKHEMEHELEEHEHEIEEHEHEVEEHEQRVEAEQRRFEEDKRKFEEEKRQWESSHHVVPRGSKKGRGRGGGGGLKQPKMGGSARTSSAEVHVNLFGMPEDGATFPQRQTSTASSNRTTSGDSETQHLL